MNASPKLKIIVIGCAAITLLLALKLITSSSTLTHAANIRQRVIGDANQTAAVMPTADRVSRVFKQFNATNMEPEPDHPANQTVTITYDLRGPKEAELLDKMNMTLLDLGIQKDERIVRQLVLARIKGDWSTTPPGPDWADNAMWQKHAAEMLKRKVGYLLPSGTNYVIEDGKTNAILIPADALTIKRVLDCDIGPAVPPMPKVLNKNGDMVEDFEVHE